jgi:hypothetical protein
MKPIPKSGYYTTNNYGRITLLSYEEVLGKSGLNILLKLASLSNLIDNYPPANMERGFDFSDYTAIQMGLEEIYGPRGSCGMEIRAGKATFNDILNNCGSMAGVTDPAFKMLPLQMKIRFWLSHVAKTFSEVSDQTTALEETDDAFIWTVHRCPSCWSRQGAEKPVCQVTVGFLKASLTWVSDGQESRVNESKCCAIGDPVCEFTIQKEPIS